jgi:uncharacterized membrane protein (UPF0136 family)
MSTAAIVVFIYGVLVAAGGIAGFVMKQSVPSLISGVLSGLLLLLGGWGLMQGASWGKILSIVVSVLLIGYFGKGLLAGKMMPAAPIVVLGVITIATVLLAK